MTWSFRLAALALLSLLIPAASLRAEQVDLKLVLAADVSRSVDERELTLQH